MGKPVTNNCAQDRVGLYVMPDTRHRLNKLRDLFRKEKGKPVSQDAAISILLDAFVKSREKNVNNQ